MNLFICICASNRPFLLKRTLYSLSKLYKPSHVNVHVVIIDNNIYSNNRSIIKKFNNKSFFKLIYKYELKKGIVNSRNKFIDYILSEKKKIDFIGFVDDDCEIDKKWLINHMRSFKDYSHISISTGPQLANKANSLEKTFYNLLNKNLYRKFKTTSWAATNNVIIRFEILKKTKIKFDLFLNNIGGSDQLFFAKLNKRNYKILWNANAKVYENLSLRKLNFNWFFKRSLRYGFSGAYIYSALHGNLVGFLLSGSKIIYLLLYSILLIPLIFKKFYFFKSLMNLIKILGIIRYLLGIKIKNYN